MAKVSDQSNIALEQYFSQGLTGVTQRKQTQVDDFNAAFKKDVSLTSPQVELYAKKTTDDILKQDVLANQVMNELKEQWGVDEGGVSAAEYAEIIHSLAASLKKEAKLYPSEGDEYKIVITAAKQAHHLEADRLLFKQGLAALLSA